MSSNVSRSDFQLLYPAKLTIICDGRMKVFSDMKYLKKWISQALLLQKPTKLESKSRRGRTDIRDNRRLTMVDRQRE